MMNEPWVQFFQEDYMLFAEEIMTPERTEYEVGQLEQLLRLPAGAEILDHGCGQGRLLVPLLRRGYRVTGYDGSPSLLAEARRRALDAGFEAELIYADMRALELPARFDAVINVGTAFGYVPSRSEDMDILRRVFQSLKSGGKFVLETENRDYKIRQAVSASYEMKGRTVTTDRAYHYETGRWVERLSWMEGGSEKTYVLDFRLYTPIELVEMLTVIGFVVEHMSGGFHMKPVQRDSPRLLIVGCKPKG